MFFSRYPLLTCKGTNFFRNCQIKQGNICVSKKVFVTLSVVYIITKKQGIDKSKCKQIPQFAYTLSF